MATLPVSPEDEERYGTPHKYDPSFKGPIKDRSCTDVCCLLLLVAFVVGWAAIAVLAFSWGNPLLLIYPSDSQGQICGQENGATDLRNKTNLLFFDITKCFSTQAIAGCATREVCVEHCPNESLKPNNMAISDQDKKKRMKPYCGQEFDDSKTFQELVDDQICPEWVVQSRSLLGRCVPSVDSSTSPAFLDFAQLKKGVAGLLEFLDIRGVAEKALNDVVESWWIIFLLLLAASFTAFLWTFLMRFVAGFMVWTSMFLTLGLLLLGTVYCGMKYAYLTDVSDNDPEDLFYTNIGPDTNRSSTWLMFLIVSGFLLLFVTVVLVFLRSRIRIAIELIEEASAAVSHMSSTLFFPVFPFLFQLFILTWFVTVGLYLASSSEQEFRLDLHNCQPDEDKCAIGGQLKRSMEDACNPEDPTTFTCDDSCLANCRFYKYGPTWVALWFQAYNVFGFVWFMFFISAMTDMVLAGAFASWYWILDKSDLPSSPVLSSFGRTFRYHLGTLAFGSLLVAIIRIIRMVVEYVDQKLKQYHQENPVVKACMCFCKCCFWCLESFMKFLSRNAFIMTAIYGKNFCRSGKEAFFLLMRNIVRVFVLDKVTDFLLFVGKLVIVSAYGILSFYIFSGRLTVGSVKVPEVNYHFVPVIIVVAGSYFIADVFFDVYEMGVDTIGLCFLEDIERNDGSHEKPYFMSKDLRRILHLNESDSHNESTPNKAASGKRLSST